MIEKNKYKRNLKVLKNGNFQTTQDKKLNIKMVFQS